MRRRRAAFRPRAGILTIGTELVTGSVLNTNAQYLSRALTRLGFQVDTQSACRDDPQAIREALREALKRSQLVIATGGLGPTPDDITRESVAEFFGVPLVFSKGQYRQISRFYEKRGRRLPKMVRREAHFPANAEPIFNRFGIALGFLIEEEGRSLIVLPGVPGELIRLFEGELAPRLKRKFQGLRPPEVLTVKTIGLSEPTVMNRLGSAFFKMGKFEFGIYPEVGEVALRIYADSKGLIERLKRRIFRLLKGHIYSLSEESLEAVIGKQLVRRHGSVAVAESCTGGKISELITRVPGASRYFRGAVVAYENAVKESGLGVPRKILRTKGAVSGETALEMARRVRERLKSTFGVGVTGIAGPTGGTPQKPVGLVYLAIAGPRESRAWEKRFIGDREQIQHRAAKKALEYLWRWIGK